MKPSILLIRPQMGENIGAAARAMANFGLGDLRLVAPRDGWPNVKASDTAGKALPIIDDAVVYETTNASVADCQFVLATTARARAMNLPVMDVREAMAEMRVRSGRGEKCAILFGPERTGLENEDIALADAVLTIPVAPEYTSLNIGQAVVVCAYEWWQAVASRPSSVVSKQVGVGTDGAAAVPLPEGEAMRLNERSEFSRSGEGAVEQAHMDSRPHPDFLSAALQTLENPTSPAGRGGPAPRQHLTGLLGQLEVALDDVNFWRVPEKKDIMWRNIRTSLVRAGLSEQEIATWRGVVKALRG